MHLYIVLPHEPKLRVVCFEVSVGNRLKSWENFLLKETKCKAEREHEVLFCNQTNIISEKRINCILNILEFLLLRTFTLLS